MNIFQSFFLCTYNDGVAFRFGIPGKGEIEIYDEVSAINLRVKNLPIMVRIIINRDGYESALGQ